MVDGDDRFQGRLYNHQASTIGFWSYTRARTDAHIAYATKVDKNYWRLPETRPTLVFLPRLEIFWDFTPKMWVKLLDCISD